MFQQERTFVKYDSKKDSQQVDNSQNQFVSSMMEKSVETLSGNGALKYSESGDEFLNQFAAVANYKPTIKGKFKEFRSFQEISKDMQLLYSIDKEEAVAFIIYLRMITRKVRLLDGNETTTVQNGQGLRHESISRMLWLYANDEEVFWNNLHLFISVGSWKDVIQLMNYDHRYHGFDKKVLNWDKLANVILAGLENPNSSELIKKYLPTIKAKSKIKTLTTDADTCIGKFISSKLFGKKNYSVYRKFKSSGTAHQWQQLISKQLYQEINFNTIHGRALAQLVSSEFMEKHGLEDKYTDWILARTDAKYTGYVYELFKNVTQGLKKYQKETINKQFTGLVNTAKDNLDLNTRFIVAVDTSASMTSEANGCSGVTSYQVAKSTALFFSHLLDGVFKDYYFEFSNRACLKQWIGNNPVDKFINANASEVASTNFLGICKGFIDMKNRNIPESEFPNGIICISDGEFNNTGTNTTNLKQFKTNLLQAGFSKEYVDNFKVVFWDIPNGYYNNKETKFETYKDHTNVYYISGFDTSAITFLFKGKIVDKNNKVQEAPKDAIELMNIALTQEVMQYIKV